MVKLTLCCDDVFILDLPGSYLFPFHEIISTPAKTIMVPASCHSVNFSSKKKPAIMMVATGPILPIMEALPEPISFIPPEIKKEGITVQNTAITKHK